MVITLVADVYGGENNGTSLSAKRLVENMKKRGHEVRVVSTFSCDDANYYTVKKRNFGIFDHYITTKNGVVFGKAQKEIIKKAIMGADVVHFLLPFKMSKCGIKICEENNIPYTTAFHCPPEMISLQLRPLNQKLLTKILYRYYYLKFYRKTKYVHCPSEMIAHKLEKNGYKTKNYVISNGVISDFLLKKTIKPISLEGKFCILSIGRLSSEKYHKTIINAVKKSKYSDKIQLIFAGSGPKEKSLIRQAKGLKNPPIISFIEKNKLIETINYCDLFVHSSKIEIEGMGCLEAISCGLVPVLSNSTDAAVSQFALSRKNLFEFSNSTDLANKIDYWIKHPKEKQKMGERYIEYMKKYRIEKCMDEMEKMFMDAVRDSCCQKDE